MVSRLTSVVHPLLRLLDPEQAHDLALWALRLGLGGRDRSANPPLLHQTLLRLEFVNPIGLAAGFDKAGVATAALGRLGFGFLEVGTLTPRAQAGASRPRIFRLQEDRALINRMGFPNPGIGEFLHRLLRAAPPQVPLGINVGPNKDTADPAADIVLMVGAVAGYADYITLNLSSPNTPGLRIMQQTRPLTRLLMMLQSELPACPPLFVKIAPDLPDADLGALIDACMLFGVAGLVIGNTTLDRSPALRSRYRHEHGGLSGRPLFDRSTALLARVRQLAGRQLVLIGCGGVEDADGAFAKIRAGASLVQLYTGFAYQGPALIPRLKRGLAERMTAHGFTDLAQAIGHAVPADKS